jgi:hypothetical protein
MITAGLTVSANWHSRSSARLKDVPSMVKLVPPEDGPESGKIESIVGGDESSRRRDFLSIDTPSRETLGSRMVKSTKLG